MEAVRVITGTGVPLVRSDVDTDQIIPSDWLNVASAFFTMLGGIVTFASVIVPFTKTPKDDEAVAWLKNSLARFSVFQPKK